MAAMTRLNFNIGPYGNFTFLSFFLKPQNRFEPNLAEMFIGWSYTRFLFLALIGNPTCFKLADWFQKRRSFNNFPIGSYVKTMSADGGHFEPRSGSLNTILEVDPLRTIDDMFAILAYWFQRRRF
jgi:hypothetical protein